MSIFGVVKACLWVGRMAFYAWAGIAGLSLLIYFAYGFFMGS